MLTGAVLVCACRSSNDGCGLVGVVGVADHSLAQIGIGSGQANLVEHVHRLECDLYQATQVTLAILDRGHDFEFDYRAEPSAVGRLLARHDFDLVPRGIKGVRHHAQDFSVVAVGWERHLTDRHCSDGYCLPHSSENHRSTLKSRHE